jgi:transposase
VVGRKNWLFAGNPDGAQASAIVFSLIETAKANSLEPYHFFHVWPLANVAPWLKLNYADS